MKRTYTGTLFHPVLTEATIIIHESKKVKWESEDSDFVEKRYTGIASWDIIEGGEEAKKIEEELYLFPDENHEYLVLHFDEVDSKSAVYFKNSHVAMFVL